jgi:hypothetical protein
MNAMILLSALILIAIACFVWAIVLLVRGIGRERRNAWNRRFVDQRFTHDPRDWRKHFDQYEKPSILRRQAE